MKLFSVLALALLASASVAQANELDNENQVKNAQRLAADLPQTLVVREDRSGNVSVFHSDKKLAAGTQIEDQKFVAMKTTDKMSELDGDSSKSGWYFYWYNYNYYYPTYYYYGYNYSYQPYYTYNTYYYTYRWYCWW